MGAIGNHEEQAQGKPINNVAAALILADKSDVLAKVLWIQPASALPQSAGSNAVCFMARMGTGVF